MTPNPSPPVSRQTLHYEGWLVLRSPLQHGGDKSFGTTRLFRAQKVVCPDGVVRRIPVYSGNAVRGLLRDIAAHQLLDALNVQVPPHVFDFLTSGGTLTASSAQKTLNLDRARELQRAVPMVGLFGGGTGNQIMEGKLIFLQGMPICSETTHVLPNYCRQAPSANLSIRDLRHMEFATRRDDKKREASQRYLDGPVPQRGQDDVATAMIFESETLAPGSCLRFGFIARELFDAERTALLMALVGFFRHPFLGARSSAGYGEVALPSLFRARRQITQDKTRDTIVDMDAPLATVESTIDPEDRLDLIAESVEEQYREAVANNRAEIVAALGRIV